MPTSLQAIANKAKSQKGYRFRNLFEMLNEEMLHDSWRYIRKDAAFGVDRVSAQEYELNLGENIQQLVENLKGKPHVKRRTSRKKLRASLKRFNLWCKENKHHRLKVLFYRLNAKLRGYYNYYGVHGNSISLNQFFRRAMWMLWRQLNQRSQRKSYNRKGFNELLEQFQVERPRIVQRPRTSRAPSVD